MNYFLKLALFLVIVFSSGCKANSTDDSFQLFWSEFRIATMKNDYEKLETFTKFPLAIYGVHDSIPIEYFKRNDFRSIFSRLMEQKMFLLQGDDFVETTMKAIVTNTELVRDAKNGEEYQVEQLVFKYIDGQWFFTKAYLAE